ncbi:hypothetical protein ABER02_20325 [Rossellomorea marisflavi]|uniref:hypothetical protein n=1 Tax=Rossellomorea marisflavi TaxID=189381 RepID=UPI003D2AB5E4
MTSYILEQVRMIGGSEPVSILVEEGMISAIRSSFPHYRFMRGDVSPFVMGPTHVFCDLEYPEYLQHQGSMDEYTAKGCTTILTAFPLEYEYEFEQNWRGIKKAMQLSPLDFIIGMKTTPQRITPGIIRKCRARKVPVIWVDIMDADALTVIPWGWIREALNHYPITFVPFFSTEPDTQIRERHLRIWQNTMKSVKIPHIGVPIGQKVPLKPEVLRKIGIHPHRGILSPGREISYNLYLEKVPEGDLLVRDTQHVLKCTMSKGECLFLNGHPTAYRGKGEEIVIRTPGFFVEPTPYRL